MLVAALLELKARGLFAGESDLEDLEPEEAAEELARRLEEYRRIKGAAEWLAERLAAERDRYFRLGPAPLAPRGERRLAQQDPEALAAVAAACSPRSRRRSRSRTSSFGSRRCRGSSSSSAPCSGAGSGSTSTTRWPGCRASSRRWRSSLCWSCAAPVRSRSSRRRRSRRSVSRAAALRGGGGSVERPLRLIAASPVDALARTLEALLVVASQPLGVAELAEAAARRPRAGRDGAGAAGRALSRGSERDRARAGRRRLGVSRLARGGGSLRPAVRAAGRAQPLAGGARDARDHRVPRARARGRRSRAGAASPSTPSSPVSSSAG